MASAVHCQLSPPVRPFVPTVMAPKLAYHRGKREEGEHQFCPETEDGRGGAERTGIKKRRIREKLT